MDVSLLLGLWYEGRRERREKRERESGAVGLRTWVFPLAWTGKGVEQGGIREEGGDV
jgi:hypothetical protein